jgi:hypothetical protein
VKETADEVAVPNAPSTASSPTLSRRATCDGGAAGPHNLYELDPDLPLGDPVVEDHATSDLLSLVGRYRSLALRRRHYAGKICHKCHVTYPSRGSIVSFQRIFPEVISAGTA